MRTLCLIVGISISTQIFSVQAESRWLQSGRLKVPEIGALCERARDVRLLARMQIISSGDEKWRRLSRQELVIEGTVMGLPPLDPGRCYVIARAGLADNQQRRAFEVYDFVDNEGRTSVLIVGRAYDPPPVVVRPGR
jgi:hypothetical protein